MSHRGGPQLAAPSAKLASKPPTGSPSVHLDALRGFAAFSVLLYHWRDFFFVRYPEIGHTSPLLAAANVVCGLGHQWVIVFFVLSGYLVGGSVLRSMDSGRWSWREYLFARLTRLYIVLLPALMLGGILDWVGMHLTDSGSGYRAGSLYSNAHASLTLTILSENALFLQSIRLPGMLSPVPAYGLNGPLWSLSNEFWYYLAFPLLVLLLAKAQAKWTRVACLLGLVAWGWFVGTAITLLSVPWLMGVLIALLPSFTLHSLWMRGIAAGAALALLAAALTVATVAPHVVYLMDLLIGVMTTFLIWVIVRCARSPLPAAYVWIAQRSARSSYTLYLTHFPLLIFLKASLHVPQAVPSWHALPVGVGLLAVPILYGQLVYELSERHTDRIRHWIRPYVMGAKAG